MVFFGPWVFLLGNISIWKSHKFSSGWRLHHCPLPNYFWRERASSQPIKLPAVTLVEDTLVSWTRSPLPAVRNDVSHQPFWASVSLLGSPVRLSSLIIQTLPAPGPTYEQMTRTFKLKRMQGCIQFGMHWRVVTKFNVSVERGLKKTEFTGSLGESKGQAIFGEDH